ncbi:MAG: aromatic acid exporter family protein [Oscillospiraceae bacterium]
MKTPPSISSNDLIETKETRKERQKLPKIGLRNIKTAISATMCAVIYFFLGRNPTFACIGAVFGMDNSLPASFKTGGNRLIGTIIGGFLGMGIFTLSLHMPYRELSRLVLIFVGIIVLIYISQLLNFAGAIQAGSVVFFIVMLNTPEDQYFAYALNRIVDTGFGVIMSIFINWVHIKLPIKSDFENITK